MNAFNIDKTRQFANFRHTLLKLNIFESLHIKLQLILTFTLFYRFQ